MYSLSARPECFLFAHPELVEGQKMYRRVHKKYFSLIILRYILLRTSARRILRTSGCGNVS